MYIFTKRKKKTTHREREKKQSVEMSEAFSVGIKRKNIKPNIKSKMLINIVKKKERNNKKNLQVEKMDTSEAIFVLFLCASIGFEFFVCR